MDALEPRRRPHRHEASYQLVTHLASGGMAELFIARRHDDPAAPHVVLKRVTPEQAKNPHFVGMFLDEARLASRLHHPNIAQVLDVGRAGSSYYYTMEYVHGENVRDLLQLAVSRQVMLPLDVCLSVLIGAATGLHAAHETRDRHGVPLGIVHRDVSPSNVMISYAGEVKLVDFGVAKAADHTTETQAGTVKGKIAYLSPEQCTGRPVDRRSDVFSLGIVAHEMVTRSRLFRRRSDYETMHAIVHAPVPAPSRLRPDVPPEVEAVILKALERAPANRQQSAAELADELTAAAARLALPVGPPVLARTMAELFGGKPLPWARIEHHDTAVIALAALAPGLVPSEREPLERSVSAAEVSIEVDSAESSSIDQAFAAVITAIAPPPREWGVGDESPGVFTWPSRDEGVEAVESTVLTSSAPGRPAAGAAAFVATDTVVTPGAEAAARRAAGASFPTARTETGAVPAPAPAARRGTLPPPTGAVEGSATVATPAPGPTTEERDAASTMKLGPSAWLDEVATTIEDRAAAARRVAGARPVAVAAPPPHDTAPDLRPLPPTSATDLAELRRAAGLGDEPPARRVTTATGPRASHDPPSSPRMPLPVAPARPAAREQPSSPRMPLPPPSPAPLATREQPSSPRMPLPPPSPAPLATREQPSSPRMPLPPVQDHPSSPRLPLPPVAPSPFPVSPDVGPAGPGDEGRPARTSSSASLRSAYARRERGDGAVPPMQDHPGSPRMVMPPGREQGHRTGPNPLVRLEARPPRRRAWLVIGGVAVAGGAVAAALLVWSSTAGDRATVAPVEPPAPPPPTAAEQLEDLRSRARAAHDGEQWAVAYDACRGGLRLAPSDGELTTICAHAACAAGNADAAAQYARRVAPDDVEAVRRRCRDAGVPLR